MNYIVNTISATPTDTIVASYVCIDIVHRWWDGEYVLNH